VKKGIHFCGRILLGLFVLWQVVFLIASLAIKIEATWHDRVASHLPYLNEHYPEYVKGDNAVHQSLTKMDAKGLRRYAQATAQVQQWRLFAPGVSDDFSFAELEVRWDDDHFPPDTVNTHALEPLFLPGVNEPEDVNSFFRYKNFRMRRYEMHISPSPSGRDGAFNPRTYTWTDQIAEAIRDNGGNMAAYLRWRWREYQRQHPDLSLPQPTQVILHVRGYGIPNPPGPSPWRFDEYGRHPVARWLPWKGDQTGVRALERYNPMTDSYESVP
jgi:hypothetical protein